ncbi:zinc finger, CCHC-type containing protein [Tanacetum coccineum]
MAVAAMKHMASNFVKLDKFEGVDFRRWQKKMHFLLSNMSVVYVLTTPMPEDGGDNPTNVKYFKELWDSLKAKYLAEDASSKKFLVSNFTNYKMTDSRPIMEQYNKLLGILGRFTQHKMNMNEAIQVSYIIDKLPPFWKDFKHTLKHKKEELPLVKLGSHMRIEESLRVQDNDKLKGNNVVGPSVVNMVEHNNSSIYNDNKGKRKHHDNTRAGPNKKAKPTCWKCGKIGPIKRDCKGVNIDNKANGSGTKGSVDGSSNSLKDVSSRPLIPLNDGSILHMGNESTTLVHVCGCVDLKFSSGKIVSLLNIVNDNIASAFMSTSKLNDSILWHARLGHVHFKRMQDMSKNVLIPTFDMNTEKCKTCMLTKITKKPFQNVKRETKVLELIHSDLCDLHATSSLGNKKYFVTFIDDASRFCYVYLLHTKDEALDKFKVFKTGVELQQGSLIKRFRIDRGGEYMDTLYFQVPNKKNKITPYELWTKRKQNLNYLRVWGCRAVVRLPDSKLKTLGEKGIECIFVGYAEHSKAFRFYVIEPNDSVSINSIIESKDAIFVENIFSSVLRPNLKIPNGTKDIGGSVIPKKVTEKFVHQPKPELRKSKRNRTQKNFRPKFQLYLTEGTGDEVSDQHSYCFNVEDDPKTFDEAMKKLKVDGTIEKLKARLVIQGFKQKLGIDYFDTYAPVAHINTIRLLIAMASIHNLIIHQMDVKTAFLNGELEEEVYINQPQGFIMPGNKNKVDLTKEFLSSRFFMKDIGEADVILGIKIKHESSGIAISQSHYIEKVLKKFNYFECTPVSTPMDTSEKLMPKNGQAVSQLKYSRVIGNLMYAMTCTRPDIAFVVGKLSRLTYTGYPLVLEGYTDASWISNTKDNSSKSGWVKPIAPIFIRCDSAATLAKAYSQMCNRKSRHLGVRHSMIRELITNRVVSIEFVRKFPPISSCLHFRDGLRESVSQLPILTDSIIMILVLSSLAELRVKCLKNFKGSCPLRYADEGFAELEVGVFSSVDWTLGVYADTLV